MKQNIKRKFSRKSYLLFKSFLDFFIAFLFLFIGFPLFLIIILLVKFSSRGPIFYQQKRIGLHNKPFYCLKFRTMHPEAEDLLKNLLEKNKEIKLEYEKNHKIKNDPRITPIGKFLRKTSLDELPQLINVLRLEMSIVGPRPIVKAEIKKYKNNFKKVISIKPGITGLWQVSGRNNLSYKKRVFLDLLYVKDINLLLDIRIIIRTIGVIFFPGDKGSY
tara:strand:- start:950 stop:1603 length:654 start_codon:yes stop_codon:yes gene_type:complete